MLGSGEDNQQIFASILETETFLIFHQWLTPSEINNLSYLDFTLYTKKLFNLFTESEKSKAEYEKSKAEFLNANFENLAKSLAPQF